MTDNEAILILQNGVPAAVEIAIKALEEVEDMREEIEKLQKGIKNLAEKHDAIALENFRLKNKISAVDVLEWLRDEHIDVYSLFDSYNSQEIVDKIAEYKKNHGGEVIDMVKEQPEVEWMWEIYDTLDPKYCVYCADEELAIKTCENAYLVDRCISYRKVCRRKR